MNIIMWKSKILQISLVNELKRTGDNVHFLQGQDKAGIFTFLVLTLV